MNLQVSTMIDGLSEVADQYRGVIVDLWGVLHDGEVAFPDAISALDALRSNGLAICLLSNAPRRARQVAERLTSMGLGPSKYNHLLTSGEFVYEALENTPDQWHAALGRRYFHLGPSDLRGLLSGSDRLEVFLPKNADFILNTGAGGQEEIDGATEVLQECASRKLPMICANPDLVVLIGNQLVICAGTLAEQYEALGGDVRYHGKPYSTAYRRALDLLGHERDEVLAVGDSLRTDVAGARNEGIDVVFIASGIHRADAGNLEQLQQLLAGKPVLPTFVASHFRW
ncbi:HAD superfamily hydrolase (TIGR01459 family) (plasmid) [Ensifer sp. WSM1721]|uniref:TIGR01459 family HAD-type hydrolase n=1 Tax=Ensifer sp. WSM1721 TaxID=1041159 RepID=UPI000A01559C|nr:TIGR01459 family HAD-type hydrolase [Ensifer sp. WSM1721]